LAEIQGEKRNPNESKIFSISFVWIILLGGLISLLFLIGNLAVLGLNRYPVSPHLYVNDADVDAGRKAVVTYGCGSCHVIPGVPGAQGRVGPSLDGINHQVYIGGVLANTPENMIVWLINPQRFSEKSAMPNLGISESEARNMTAFLYANAEQSWVSRLIRTIFLR
jgi:cytochrome c2